MGDNLGWKHLDECGSTRSQVLTRTHVFLLHISIFDNEML